jgi:hypothetical protein
MKIVVLADTERLPAFDGELVLMRDPGEVKSSLAKITVQFAGVSQM